MCNLLKKMRALALRYGLRPSGHKRKIILDMPNILIDRITNLKNYDNKYVGLMDFLWLSHDGLRFSIYHDA